MPDSNGGEPKVRLQIHYIKSPEYREVVCTGAIGGSTPEGKIWMSLFAERGPIPRVVEYEFPAPPAGQPLTIAVNTSTPVLRAESRQGVIRHVEFTAYLDKDFAKQLSDWLLQQINTDGKGGA